MPKANLRDLKDMDSPSIKKLRVIGVEHMDEVLKEAMVREDTSV